MANLLKCKRCGSDIQPGPRSTNQRFCGEVCRDEWWNEQRSKQVTRGEWAERRYGPTDKGNLTEVEKAWLAAMIDGEGTVGIYRGKQPRNRSGWRYAAVVSFCNTNEPLALRFAELTDCWSVMQRKRRKLYDRDIFIVTVKCRGVEELLTQVMPYLIAKQEQARIVVEFSRLIAASPMRTSLDHSIYDTFYQRTIALNSRGKRRQIA